MAAHSQSRFSSSPPPSPPRRRHVKQHDDPFLAFDIQSPSPSDPSLSSNEQQEPQDSLFTRIILTPVLFTSFLVSLFLVNRSDRVRRTNSNSHKPASLLSYFSPTAWLDPEPYQDPSNATWARRGTSSHVEPHSVLNPQNEHRGGGGDKERQLSWHLNKKIHKVARLEISDAFEMRGKVMVILLSAAVLGVGVLILSVRWMVGSAPWV